LKTKRIAIRITEKMYEYLTVAQKLAGRPMPEVIRKAIAIGTGKMIDERLPTPTDFRGDL
jgi:predicted DNA-binding protein